MPSKQIFITTIVIVRTPSTASYPTHVFVPVAIETGGSWHHQAVELVQEIGRRAANTTGDVRESNFLFQQLSVALQRGNMRSHFKTRSPSASSLQSVVSYT